MAALTSHHQMIEALRAAIKIHVGGLESLANALAREGDHLARRHQADLILALRATITQQVEATRLAEDKASSDFTQRKRSKSSSHNVVGIILALLSDGRHNVQRDIALAETELSRTAPFGTVAVQVAPPGVPDGVTTVSLSRMARHGWTSESNIKACLEAKGCRLIEPGVFVDLLNKLEQDILNGSVVLPLTCDQLGVYLASREPKAETVHLPMLIPRPGCSLVAGRNPGRPAIPLHLHPVK